MTLVLILARVISSVVNFTLNRKVVFKRGQSNSAIKILHFGGSTDCFVKFIGNSSRNALTTLPISLVKILVDGTLFIVSYLCKTFDF